MRLFQRYAAATAALEIDCRDASASSSSTPSSYSVRDIFVPLWVEYVVPSCVRVQHILVKSAANCSRNSNDNRNDNDWSWVQAAVAASVVSTTARLAECLYQEQGQGQGYSTNVDNNIIDNTHSSPAFRTVASMLVSISDIVLDGRLETLCQHPWRSRLLTLPASVQAAIDDPKGTAWQSLSLEAALVVWTSAADDENDEDDDDDENENDNLLFRMREQVAGVETVWEDVGVAILVAVGLQADSLRPQVWSHTHVWRMGFPHVATLLNADDDADNIIDDGDNINEGGVLLQSLGFQLLDTLLRIVPNHALPTPSQAASESDESEPSPPAVDSPIGTLQLISNRIVASASASSSKKDSASVNEVGQQQQQQQQQPQLPDATRAFQLMKELVGKYQPFHQVAIVKQLVQDCPHSGLKPKLLDMLRVCVSWGEEDEDTELGLSHVWSYLDTLVDNMQEHIHVGDASEILRDATTLIDNVELYVSALSLMHLWVLVKKKGLGIDHLSTRLTSVHVAVRSALTHWSNDECAPDVLPEQHFRLDLLEMSLENTLNVLNGIEGIDWLLAAELLLR
jgi:hypothetical protein